MRGAPLESREGEPFSWRSMVGEELPPSNGRAITGREGVRCSGALSVEDARAPGLDMD